MDVGERSAITPITSSIAQGVQVFQLSEKESGSAAGDCWKPIPHKSALLHASGEACYVEDTTPFKGDFYSLKYCVRGLFDGTLDSLQLPCSNSRSLQ